MVDIARPRLAEGLAALTSTPVGLWLPWMKPFPPTSGAGVRWALTGERVTVHITLDGRDVSDGPTATWTVTDTADAQETLVARGLLPEGWCGDVRRGWYCAACTGLGVPVYSIDPHTIPDLVAVASLGWPAIHLAEELARAACAALREYGCPQPERVVWRVGSRSPSDAVLWRSPPTPGHRAVVSVRGVVLVDGRLDVRPDRRVVAGAEALWTSGLALDAITADAVRIVVPPVGGAVRPAEWGPQPSGVYGWGR